VGVGAGVGVGDDGGSTGASGATGQTGSAATSGLSGFSANAVGPSASQTTGMSRMVAIRRMCPNILSNVDRYDAALVTLCLSAGRR
jgi:hypothetical protein